MNFRNRFQSKGSGNGNSHSKKKMEKHSSSKYITEIDSSGFLDKKGAHSISIAHSPRKKETRNLSSQHTHKPGQYYLYSKAEVETIGGARKRGDLRQGSAEETEKMRSGHFSYKKMQPMKLKSLIRENSATGPLFQPRHQFLKKSGN